MGNEVRGKFVVIYSKDLLIPNEAASSRELPPLGHYIAVVRTLPHVAPADRGALTSPAAAAGALGRQGGGLGY